jgi:hypothetical protein
LTVCWCEWIMSIAIKITIKQATEEMVLQFGQEFLETTMSWDLDHRQKVKPSRQDQQGESSEKHRCRTTHFGTAKWRTLDQNHRPYHFHARLWRFHGDPY